MSVFDQGSPAALFAAVAAGAALKYVAGFMFPKGDRDKYRYVGRVAAVWVYPFKSFRGLSVNEAECTAVGMNWRDLVDRHFAVATENGVYLTQRQEPTMALIEPVLNGNKIMLMAPGMPPVSIPVCPQPTKGNLSKCTVKTDTIDSVDCGDEVSNWLCQYFKRPGLRLHFSAPGLEKRDASKNKKEWKHPAKPGDLTAFSDYCGYMVLSNASLQVLNEKLETPVPMDNFRANIIVDDCEPFAEDGWSSLRIGQAQLRALDACTRCVLVTVDQFKGVKHPKEEPLSTLKKFRLKDPYGQKPCFGINFTLDLEKSGKIKVGDPIYALRI